MEVSIKSFTQTRHEIKENKDYFLNKNDKMDLIGRINKSKTETIMWIVGIGVLQFILTILSKNFL